MMYCTALNITQGLTAKSLPWCTLQMVIRIEVCEARGRRNCALEVPPTQADVMVQALTPDDVMVQAVPGWSVTC
jgi:hypothetical protein